MLKAIYLAIELAFIAFGFLALIGFLVTLNAIFQG